MSSGDPARALAISKAERPAPPVRFGPMGAGGWAWLAAKIAVSGGVLWFALRRIDADALAAAAGDVNAAWLALALVVLIISITATALRWSFLTRPYAPVSVREATAITFAAQFLGQVLPSSLGQDAVRAWLALSRQRSAADTIAIIFADRVCGLLGLCAIILAGLPLLARLAGFEQSAGVAMIAVAFALAAFVGALCVQLVPAPVSWPPFVQKCFAAAQHASILLTSRAGLVAIGVSICAQLLAIGSIWLIAASIGAPLSLIEGFAAIPPAVFLSLMPISINGWGVREGAMVVSLGFVGVAGSDALLISVLFGCALLATSLPGAFALLLLKRKQWIPPQPPP